MQVFIPDIVQQLNIIKSSNENFLNVETIHQEFKDAINNINIGKYKGDPSGFYKHLAFSSEDYKETMQQEEKDIFQNLISNILYKTTMLKYFNISNNYFIKYSIVRFTDEKNRISKNTHERCF